MRWKAGGALLIVAVLTVVVAVRRGKECKHVAADGTVLVLSGVKIGPSNVYTHGTLLSKVLGPVVPAKGISLAGRKLQPPIKIRIDAPKETTVLSAEVHLVRSGSARRELSFIQPGFHGRFRLLISGEDDFAFVQEFDRFKMPPDGIFGYFSGWIFPRDSRLLRFRLEERDDRDTREWREVAAFTVANPNRATIESWKTEPSTRFSLNKEFEVEAGELVVRHELLHPTDIGEYVALLPVRITKNIQALTNWGIRDGTVRDATGNFAFFPVNKIKTNDWIVYRMSRPLDPARPWRFDVNFALDSNFPASNLFSFTLPLPLKTTIQTNLAGLSIHIGFATRDMLSVELADKPAGTRLTFVKATDEEGTNLDRAHVLGSGSFGQHFFWKTLKMPQTPRMDVTVAIHSNYAAQFTLLPRLENEPAAEPSKKNRPSINRRIASRFSGTSTNQPGS